MRRHLLAIAAATVLLAPRLSAQTTIYSTFGPGDSYLTCCGDTVASSDLFVGLGITLWEAANFLYGGPSGDRLSGLRFAAWNLSTPPGPLDIAFLSGATIGGASVLESWVIPNGSGSPQIYSLSSLLDPVLTFGQTYWVRLSPGAATKDWWAWNVNGVVEAGACGSINAGASWRCGDPTPAFDVSSVPGVVPEPGTLPLLATGLVGLAAISRRRRTRI